MKKEALESVLQSSAAWWFDFSRLNQGDDLYKIAQLIEEDLEIDYIWSHRYGKEMKNWLEIFEVWKSLDQQKPKNVKYSLCKKLTDKNNAHRHQKKWIGEECWDERLKAYE